MYSGTSLRSKECNTFHILIKSQTKILESWNFGQDDHFSGYLWPFLAVCLYTRWRTFWLPGDTWSCLAKGFAIQWHSYHEFNDSWTSNVSLVHNTSKTGNSYRCQTHLSHVHYVVQNTCETNCKLNRSTPDIHTAYSLQTFCGSSLLWFEHLCIVGFAGKCCLTFAYQFCKGSYCGLMCVCVWGVCVCVCVCFSL